MKLVAFDTETGGLNPLEQDLLTAYFAVLDENLNVVAELDLKLKPNDGRRPVVTEEAMKVNGIDLEKHLLDPETLTYSEGKSKLALFLASNLTDKKARTLQPAGHNVDFDVKFVQTHLLPQEIWGKLFTHRTIDTSHITSFLKLIKWWPESVGSLTSIVKYLGLPMRNAHNAKGDTLMFVDVLKAMISIFKDKKAEVSGVDLSVLRSLER
jgi:DNA polymerase III epsilon subunit-like protein